MSVQLQYSYFPVREAEMKARIEYVTLTPNESVQVGSAKVTPCLLNHPVIDFGYRVECNGKSVFFTGDHEPPYNIYEPGEEGYSEYQAFVDEKNQSIYDAMRDVDVLIADSSYTDAEYASKKGWGHGTYGSSIAIAKAAGVKVLYCTHHEPTRSDDALETVFAAALDTHANNAQGLDVRLAREGDVYEF
jgi:ribonuclease BN (tRNA processing enzyme)